MAIEYIGTSNPLAVKAWSKKLSVEVSKALDISKIMGRSNDSILQVKTEISKGKGDKVTFGLRHQLRGDGVSERQILEGNEEATTHSYNSLEINELRHASRLYAEDSIVQKRVYFDLRQEALEGLKDWFADRLSLMFFLQVCGYTGQNTLFEGDVINIKSVHYGFNQPTAPSKKSNWIILGNKESESALSTEDTFNLQVIDVAVERAKLANPKLRPINIDGGKYYVMYLHPQQVTALRSNTEQGQWLDIQKSAYSGSKAKNPIFDGSLGVYNGVVLRESEHVTTGIDANGSYLPHVRRAVLLGAQAAVIGFGLRDGNRYKIDEEFFDYKNQLGVACKTLIGMKKVTFDDKDYGTIVVSTYVNDASTANSSRIVVGASNQDVKSSKKS